MIGLSQLRRPCKVLCQVVQHRWELRERLDAGVPGLPVHRLPQRCAREALVLLEPIIGDRDLVRKRGGAENLGHQSVRIERDGRDQALQFLGGHWRALSRIVGRRRGAVPGRRLLVLVEHHSA